MQTLDLARPGRFTADIEPPKVAAMMSGTQVLARLPLELRQRDQAAGLNTGGFISGYRGSPLGGYDQELWRLGERLQELNIRFQPGVNEDLAATAVWGSQYVGLYPGANVAGVFGIWYGKSPGVDRSGDALQHANTAGTAPLGGVVALVGDDHAAKSSSRAGQSDFQLKACGIPTLYPADVQEVLDFGVHALAMSRHSGCWVALKLATDVVETSATVDLSLERLHTEMPAYASLPEGGLHIRPNEPPLAMEARLYEHKIPAALAYARANRLNRIVFHPDKPRIGIVSAGKSWGDTQHALELLGLDQAQAEARGLRLLKLGMTWPVDPEILREFAQGLDTVLVVEEKRPFIEEQIKAILYDLGCQARVMGKAGPQSNVVSEVRLPQSGELSPLRIAQAIAALMSLPAPAVQSASAVAPAAPRLPNFCSGCPHNTSTVVPQGSRAMAGIGCHGMAMWIRPETTGTVTHMGAEGMFWVGQAPFTNEQHVFVNLGDGTFFHSGSLALRQAVAARVRVTYKILFNGYVSMTGGQPHDGEVTVPRIVDIVRAEGVTRIAVVTDDLERYRNVRLAPEVSVRPRTELDLVQRELRDFDGVSVLVYDQACATELRRQRKKDRTLDVAKRVFINPEVCEGCGDCSVKSNCMSVEPLETDLGRKRRINQSSCNKDFSCVQGFCPSFVTVHGGTLKRPRRRSEDEPVWAPLPVPQLPSIEAGYNALLAGVGGTGIVTVGALLGQAAQVDGLSVSVLDVTGLAQKYGAVMAHVRFLPGHLKPHSARLGAGEADVVIGCDLIVTAGEEALGKMAPGRTFAIVNTALAPTSDFTRTPDWAVDVPSLLQGVELGTGGELQSLDATELATALMGNAIAVNLFLLGYAWQQGRLPVTLDALHAAIEKNGVEVEFNKQSLEWGRRAACDLARVQAVARKMAGAQIIQLPPRTQKLEDLLADRVARLTAYQNAAYASRYRAAVELMARKDAAVGANGQLALAAARYYYKLLANKDEFEVARLYSSAAFREQIQAQFEGDYKLHIHLGAWPFVRRQRDGSLVKRELGPWALRMMGLLQHLRVVRNTWLDPFRLTSERKLARLLLGQYERDLALVADAATSNNLAEAIALLSLPEDIRGYGHVREAHVERILPRREALRTRLAQAESRRTA